jgi:hypothetical protein
MAYRRRSSFNSDYKYQKTKVSIHWSNKASAYQIIFNKTGQYYPTKERFSKIKDVLISYISKLPYGEKEMQVNIRHEDVYNSKTGVTSKQEVQDWTYYIHEKHLNNFRNLVEMMPEDFEVDFVEKPINDNNNGFQSRFTPTEVYLDRFKEITGQDIRSESYDNAKRYFRRSCMLYHPDRNPGNMEIAAKMAQLNECWSALEIQHFKTKQEIQYNKDENKEEKEPINV